MNNKKNAIVRLTVRGKQNLGTNRSSIDKTSKVYLNCLKQLCTNTAPLHRNSNAFPLTSTIESEVLKASNLRVAGRDIETQLDKPINDKSIILNVLFVRFQFDKKITHCRLRQGSDRIFQTPLIVNSRMSSNRSAYNKVREFWTQRDWRLQ